MRGRKPAIRIRATKNLESIECPKCGMQGCLQMKTIRVRGRWFFSGFSVEHSHVGRKSFCYLGKTCPSLVTKSELQQKSFRCCDCGKEICKGALRCKSCSNRHRKGTYHLRRKGKK